MINLDNISFSHGENIILKNLTASFQKGKLYCIIGKNGSGKSTLLRLVSGYLKPCGGNITVEGMQIKEYSHREYAKRIALLPQEKDKVNISVYDYVSCGRYPYLGITKRLSSEDKLHINEAIDKMQLRDRLFEDVSKLSGGERQRVYIASVLAQNTPYVLLDEPATYLDISAKFDVMNSLRKMADDGKGVIAVMHDISLAMRFSDILLILDRQNGKYYMCTPQEAYKSGCIGKVFDVNCTQVRTEGRTEYIISDK